MLLALDTATATLSLAIHDGQDLLADCSLRVGRQHNRLLAPLLQQVMASCALQIEDLSALAVAVGPGSYTGLRVGLALAQGIAAARELPLVPVSTLDVIMAAQADAAASLPLVAVLPAGRRRVIWAQYRRDGGTWQELHAPRSSTWLELMAAIERPTRLSGDIDPAARQALQPVPGIQVLSAAQRLRRAGLLAQLAWQRLHAPGAKPFPAAQAQPIYLNALGNSNK